MSSTFKKCLLAFPLCLNLYCQPLSESSSTGQWDASNRATLRHGEVVKNNTVIFKIERHGNVAFMSLVKKPSPLERGFWIIEIHSQGQNFFASWDKKREAWKFNLMNKGNYEIYISKRKNSNEKISYAWFTISN